MKIILVDVNTGTEREITKKQLARIALELFGGGYTECQVTESIDWSGEVYASDEAVAFAYKDRGFTVKVEKHEDVA